MFCILTLSEVGKILLRKRKRPHKTNKNRNHVDKVWGNDPINEVHVPAMINDYNHWMSGVDVADQMIAYNHPNLRCQRNWYQMHYL